MSPGQRKQLAYWAMLRQPELPEAQYTSAEISMRLTPDHEWRTTWTLGGRTTSLTHYLIIDRDWDTGQARETTVLTRENLLGRPAPPLAVQDPDGRPRTLALPAGRTFLVYFREPWVVPYVGKDPDADLALLAGLLARRPELRDRAAVICPRERPADLRGWLAQSPKALPVFVDESGSLAKAYGAEAFPQAVLIGPDGRIQLVRSGYDEVMGTEWQERLR